MRAYRRGRLSGYQLSTWWAAYPREIPRIDGHPEWIAATLVDVCESPTYTERLCELGVRRLQGRPSGACARRSAHVPSPRSGAPATLAAMLEIDLPLRLLRNGSPVASDTTAFAVGSRAIVLRTASAEGEIVLYSTYLGDDTSQVAVVSELLEAGAAPVEPSSRTLEVGEGAFHLHAALRALRPPRGSPGSGARAPRRRARFEGLELARARARPGGRCSAADSARAAVQVRPDRGGDRDGRHRDTPAGEDREHAAEPHCGRREARREDHRQPDEPAEERHGNADRGGARQGCREGRPEGKPRRQHRAPDGRADHLKGDVLLQPPITGSLIANRARWRRRWRGRCAWRWHTRRKGPLRLHDCRFGSMKAGL